MKKGAPCATTGRAVARNARSKKSARATKATALSRARKLRKALVEHPFGTIKRWFGYTYFLVKGLEMVRAEWSLITLAYNLKRVLNLVSFPALMRAMQERTAVAA